MRTRTPSASFALLRGVEAKLQRVCGVKCLAFSSVSRTLGIYDRRHRGRVHPATLWGGLALMLSFLAGWRSVRPNYGWMFRRG